MAALNSLNPAPKFSKLKVTAATSCNIESARDACWEDSEEYFWSDMTEAMEKMAKVGVAGNTFYAGEQGTGGHKYGLANLAAFIAQTMQETIQYDACDENNWSEKSALDQVSAKGGDPGEIYPASAACGQLGQSYGKYVCPAEGVLDPESGEMVPPEEVQCAVDNNMYLVAKTSAMWAGSPPPLFCAPKTMIAETPRWDYNSWCPWQSPIWGQSDGWSEPFGTMAPGDVYYGPNTATENVPPEVVKADYPAYVKAAVDQSPGDACLLTGTCCIDKKSQKGGSWKSCPGGCANSFVPNLAVGDVARTDVEGCCWWGRGAIQTTGICNFGKLNYFAGKKAADRGKSALYPDVDFCTNPGAICSAEYPSLRWFAGLFYWIADVEPYDVRNAKYIETLKKWVDDGMDVNDHSLIDFASGVVNRGCHDAPYNVGDADPCGNGLLHARDERRMNFKYMWSILAPLAG